MKIPAILLSVAAAATLATSRPMPETRRPFSTAIGKAEDYNLTSPIFKTSAGIYANSSPSANETFTTSDGNSTSLDSVKNDFGCLESNHSPYLPRMSFKFKGYCTEEWGQCFLRALRKHHTIAINWQCWERDDGWWQADYTHFHAYNVAKEEYNEALTEVIGHETSCG